MNTFKTQKGTELPLSNLRGKDYLEVKYRLVWFREEHPDWPIETEIVEMSASHCVARAVVKNQSGFILSTGHKHEDKQGFADYREKAETGAIGRALAHIGYGTQFAPELDEGDRLADAPVERRVKAQAQKPAVAMAVGKEYTIRWAPYKGLTLKNVPLEWVEKTLERALDQQANDKNIGEIGEEFVEHALAFVAAQKKETKNNKVQIPF